MATMEIRRGPGKVLITGAGFALYKKRVERSERFRAFRFFADTLRKGNKGSARKKEEKRGVRRGSGTKEKCFSCENFCIRIDNFLRKCYTYVISEKYLAPSGK